MRTNFKIHNLAPSATLPQILLLHPPPSSPALELPPS